jgi:2-methylisocitrate lyase-like PEP mutase family enzyme
VVKDQATRIARFRVPHAGPEAFIPGHAWSIGSARRLEAVGYAVIGTSSTALAERRFAYRRAVTEAFADAR